MNNSNIEAGDTPNVGLRERRRSNGHRAEQIHRFVHEGDPLADEVVRAFAALKPRRGQTMLNKALAEGIENVPEAPAPLRALFEHVDHVPFWVDWDTIFRGGEPFRRSGALSALIMGCYALPLAYSSGAGVKPLIFSGRLVRRAPRRLAETAYFIEEITKPGGLKRYAGGFAAVIRVRLMHAQVRHLLRRSERWDTKQWGAPINQIEMAGTNLFFSVLAVDGLRKVGMRMSRRQVEDTVQALRYAGYLIGIHPDLLTATESEARRLSEVIMSTRLNPDEDSRALVKALMESALPALVLANKARNNSRREKRIAAFGYGLSTSLLGRERSGELGYPKTLWRFGALLALRFLIWPTELLRLLIPGGTSFVVTKATGILQKTTERVLSGRPVTYDMPERLDNLGSRPAPDGSDGDEN